jgi:hypothetical protein
MYGRKKYGRPNLPPAVTPAQDTSIPTFVCLKCGRNKSTANPFIELSAVQDGKLFIYSKVCEDCAKLLKDWFNK